MWLFIYINYMYASSLTFPLNVASIWNLDAGYSSVTVTLTVSQAHLHSEKTKECLEN